MQTTIVEEEDNDAIDIDDAFIKHKKRVLKELQQRRLNEGVIMRKEFKKYKVKTDSCFTSMYNPKG